MSKIDDETLLNILNRKEDDAADYIHGELGADREKAMREYHRMEYGNEQEGWSKIVASDVQDSVEWILPSLLKTFTSTDKAVSFEPTTARDVAGAEQATDACNYVFYKQNNGFLVLYTAIKDMLTVRNCAVMWRKEEKETISSLPFKNASEEMLVMLGEDGELDQLAQAQLIDEATGMPAFDELMQPVMVYSGRVKKTEKRSIVKVEAFSPELLLVDKDWNSPLLHECPYVSRLMPVTLSDLKMMGFKVTAEEVRSSDATDFQGDGDGLTRVNSSEDTDTIADRNYEEGDDSMVRGWLRIEFVLIDRDGDGIAERLCIYRLRDKILKVEEVSHVPIATSSPILNAHRWDGMSIHDLVADLQKLHTDLIRQTIDNLKLTNNPRKTVLTDANNSPFANIDDLLDSRVGGIVRTTRLDAVRDELVPFTAGASMPMLEYVQGMRENRTGVSRTSQGLNADSLNNTATGRQLDASAAMQRIELIARIIAETLLKPIFQGILKELTDGDMKKLAFRLRDEFVEYDPNEWRDSYDMTINVGLGSGDAQSKASQLMMIAQLQKEGLAIGLAEPKHLYHTGAKIIENAGFKDVQNFIQDPSKQPPKPPQPPIELQIEQARLSADAQKFQASQQAEVQKFQAQTQMAQDAEQIKASAKLQEIQANLELQAANDARDSEREMQKALMAEQLAAQKLEFDKWKAEFEAQTKIYIEEMKLRGAPLSDVVQHKDDMMQVLTGLQAVIQQMGAPKMIVRGADGRAIGVQSVQTTQGD
jgi:hypothetical protein